MDPDTEVAYEWPTPPLIRQYKSGRVLRFVPTVITPAGADPHTGVTSKDVVIDPVTGLWVRISLPTLALNGQRKLPVFVHYHGGAFVIGGAADPFTTVYLNDLVTAGNLIVVSVEYRLAPEHPLPIAYDDCWAALKWVASHASSGDGQEPWLAEHGDFSRVFVTGASAGGTIAHNIAARAGAHEWSPGFTIKGLLIVHPYFDSEEALGLGREASDPAAKATAVKHWRFVCPGTVGLNDPLCNPFADGESPAKIRCERVLVCVAEKDGLRDRGVWYYEKLKASGFPGEVELHETEGEGHVFFCFQPAGEKALELRARTIAFIDR